MTKEEDVLSSYSKDQLEELLIKHFVTLNRYGDKGIEVERVKLNSESYKFLQRMEKKRLATECNQALDMRGKQPDKVVEFEYQHLTHHLDKKSRQIFDQKLKEYDGKFTQGVYEAVVNAEHTYKTIQKREDELRLKELKRQQVANEDELDLTFRAERQRYILHESELLSFGSLINRKEPRLMYITEIEVTEPGQPSVTGRTRDISVEGLYITVDADEFHCKVGDALTVEMIKLEEELKIDELVAIFEVLKVVQKKDKLHINLYRKDDGTSQNYIPTIESFVESNIRRYKADYQDVIEQTAARLYEHNYCKNFLDLPLIVSFDEDEFRIEAALVNELNKDLLHDLTHGATSSSFNLNTLVNHMLPRLMTTDEDRFAQSTVGSYMFTPRGGEPKLFVACDRQYVNKDEQKKFLAVGKCCNRFKLHKVLCAKISQSDKSKAYKQIEQQPNYQPVELEEAKDYVDKSKYIVVVQDITSSLRQKMIPSVQLTDKQLSAASKAFESYVINPKLNLMPKRYEIGFKPTRKEDRYVYEIDVNVYSEYGNFKGVTMDFSINGLGIKLDSKCNLSTGTPIKIGLPTFVERTKDKSLNQMEYRVLGVSDDKTELYLIKIPPKTGEHRGSEFFKMIIDKNADKLAICPKENLTFFQTHISQIFLIGHLLSLPFFIGRRDKAYSLNSMGYNKEYAEILKAFSVAEQEYELPFLLNPSLLDILAEGAKSVEKKGLKYFQTVFFSYFDEDGCISIKLIDKDFKSPKELASFIAEHKAEDNFHCFLFKMQQSENVPVSEFEEELSKVRVHSINRYRQLVEELNSLRFVGEIISIDEQLL